MIQTSWIHNQGYGKEAIQKADGQRDGNQWL